MPAQAQKRHSSSARPNLGAKKKLHNSCRGAGKPGELMDRNRISAKVMSSRGQPRALSQEACPQWTRGKQLRWSFGSSSRDETPACARSNTACDRLSIAMSWIGGLAWTACSACVKPYDPGKHRQHHPKWDSLGGALSRMSTERLDDLVACGDRMRAFTS